MGFWDVSGSGFLWLMRWSFQVAFFAVLHHHPVPRRRAPGMLAQPSWQLPPSVEDLKPASAMVSRSAVFIKGGWYVGGPRPCRA